MAEENREVAEETGIADSADMAGTNTESIGTAGTGTKGRKAVIYLCIAVLVLVGLSNILPSILRTAAKPPEVTIGGNPLVIGETKLQDLPGYTASKVDNPLMLRLPARSWASLSLDREKTR